MHDYWGAQGAALDTLRVGYTAGLRWAAGHFAAVLEEFRNVIDPLDPSGGTMLEHGHLLAQRVRPLRLHNKLLVSIAHAMGRTEINYFGDRDLKGRAEYQGPLVPLMV